jgi:hypothetical protein
VTSGPMVPASTSISIDISLPPRNRGVGKIQFLQVGIFAFPMTLREHEAIKVYPGQVQPQMQSELGQDFKLTSHKVGGLLRGIGLKAGSKEPKGNPFTVTRVEYLERAAKYGFPAPAFPAAKDALWDLTKTPTLHQEAAP